MNGEKKRSNGKRHSLIVCIICVSVYENGCSFCMLLRPNVERVYYIFETVWYVLVKVRAMESKRPCIKSSIINGKYARVVGHINHIYYCWKGFCSSYVLVSMKIVIVNYIYAVSEYTIFVLWCIEQIRTKRMPRIYYYTYRGWFPFYVSGNQYRKQMAQLKIRTGRNENEAKKNNNEQVKRPLKATTSIHTEHKSNIEWRSIFHVCMRFR